MSVLSMIPSTRCSFLQARTAYVKCLSEKGYLTVSLGCAMLGAGMYVVGTVSVFIHFEFFLILGLLSIPLNTGDISSCQGLSTPDTYWRNSGSNPRRPAYAPSRDNLTQRASVYIMLD